ncbi:MAG: hypothetical protein CL572_02255 [Alphaproteobacteria bacterium]|nr:hypothetical protein [Alphaproteobacteria bacterium]
MRKIVTVDSPARIHLGFLETNENSLRKFGSIGLGITHYKNIFKIEFSNKREVICDNKILKEKIFKILEIFSNLKKIYNCKITVNQYIPIHKGLGSGTQHSLTTGFLISEFNSLNMSIEQISELLNRGKRSGIGIEVFKRGGFVIDLGKKKNSGLLPLKIFEYKWPKEWKIILIQDENFFGLHGRDENKEFLNIKKIKKSFVQENCFVTMMHILPGIVERDFENFTKGVSVIQKNMSKVFYGKSNIYASKNITKIFNYLNSNGYCGYGQSSWGPTGFIFCQDNDSSLKLSKDIQNLIELKKIKGINLRIVGGRNKGKIKTMRIKDD